MIPEEFIKEVLNRTDIVSVIDRDVPLKKTGINYSACCPFHNEKTPSFTVSPSKQFYHCFGCGAHGSAISFLMEHKGLSFIETIKQLSSEVGLIIPDDKTSYETKDTKGIVDVMTTAAIYYQSKLKTNKVAIDYLKSRGVTGEIALEFKLGYAPPEWKNLATALPDYDKQDMTDSGLIIASESGNKYDRFRDRITFPILNLKGEIIAFGARIINGEVGKDGPKYLNSPETPVFQKGNELYGLYEARKAIKDAGHVLVFEGYMDVISAAQFGFRNSVATLGTATTTQQISKLNRHADEVVFCFDGDIAGNKAAWKAAQNAIPTLTERSVFKFLFFPDGHDPDSFVRQNGKDAFSNLIASALPLSDYLIKYLTANNPLSSSEDKVKFLSECNKVISQIPIQSLGLLLQNKISEITELTEQQIKSIIPVKLTEITHTPRPILSISDVRKLTIGCVIQSDLSEKINLDIFNLENSDELQLREVVTICGKNKGSNAAVILLSLKGVLNDQFITELENDIGLFDNRSDLNAETLHIQEKILSKRERDSVSSLISRLSSKKSLSDLTTEERADLLAKVSRK